MSCDTSNSNREKNSTKLYCDDCSNKSMWDNSVGNKMALTFLLQIIMIFRDSVNRLREETEKKTQQNYFATIAVIN